MAPLPHKRHRRPLHNRYPHPVRQQPHHRRMRHPRQLLQFCPSLLQRNRKDIPLHIPAKDTQQLRPRHMRIPFKLNRGRRRNHKPFIMQQITLRHQINRKAKPKQQQPPHTPAKTRPHFVFGNPRNLSRTSRLPAHRRSIIVVIRIVRKIPGKILAEIAAHSPLWRSRHSTWPPSLRSIPLLRRL